MSEITRIGVDLAKNVIQIHAVDASGKVVSNRALPARGQFGTKNRFQVPFYPFQAAVRTEGAE